MSYFIAKISEDEPIFATSRYGKPLILVGHYRFNKWIGSKGPKIRWKCSRCGKGCRAFITTVETEIIKCNFEHNHK